MVKTGIRVADGLIKGFVTGGIVGDVRKGGKRILTSVLLWLISTPVEKANSTTCEIFDKLLPDLLQQR